MAPALAGTGWWRPFRCASTTPCVVASVELLKSSGFTDYDALIADTIRGTWQYSPYVVNGQPTPAVHRGDVHLHASDRSDFER